MRIRTGFQLILVVAGILIVAAAVALGYSQVRMSSTVVRSQALDTVVTEGMQLVQLTNEVLLYGGRRAVQQWHVQVEDIHRLIGDERLTGDATTDALVGRVAAEIADMRPLFEGLVQLSRDDGMPAVEMQRGRLLSSQLFQKATLPQATLRDVKGLSERHLNAAYADARDRQQLIFGFVGAAFLAFGAMIMQVFRRRRRCLR
jgi:hypothetical protein